ncbi:MAG: membrane protein insertion efficiency factor YidD [Candidatus Paceibacterota bacterium]
MKNAAIRIINIYKNNSSRFWIGSPFILFTNCKYHPTCSEYTTQAIEKYGFFNGLGRGILRILRCNPFSKGGIDLP